MTTITHLTYALFPRLLVKHRIIGKDGTNIAEEEHNESSEGDNTPIVASLLPKKKKKKERKYAPVGIYTSY